MALTRIIRNQIQYYSSKVKFSKPEYVPPYSLAMQSEISVLQDLIYNSKRLLVITGAGVSTESGIPDYRSEGVGLYARSSNRPVQYQDFLKKPEIRQRYWSRNFVGWPTFSSVMPNKNHALLSQWESKGIIHWLVTQNVDSLHYKAGSKDLTELHGSAHQVHCLGCDNLMSRIELQRQIELDNPTWHSEALDLAPDGDVQLSQDQIDGFKVPKCRKCGGILKPDIVFFGDNVPKPRVEFVHQKVKESDMVLVLGSSLEVFSGYRFVSAAKDQQKTIAIINIGPTRADKLTDIKISTKCSDVLDKICV